MESGSKTRQTRRQSRPVMESLEDRALLSLSPGGSLKALQTTATNDLVRNSPLRTFQYGLPGGGRVDIQLFGAGELNGTTVNNSGALNLRFSGTNEFTGIFAKVTGGDGHAPLQSVQSLTLPSGSVSGVGGSLVDVISLPDFDLVPGGRINLTSGMHVLNLNSVAADTSVNLRELPEVAGSPVFESPRGVVTTPNTAVLVGPGGVQTGGATSTAAALAAATTARTSAAAASIPSSTNAGGSSSTANTGTAALATSATLNGQTLAYSVNSSGGQTLSSVSGVFVPGSNVLEQNVTYGSPNPQPGAPPAPPGVVINIPSVNGPARDTALLGSPQIFGYDPTTNTLIRFDAAFGNSTLAIKNPIPTPRTEAGVALATVGGTQDVLISDGSNVYAYNANTGGSVGKFSLSNPQVDTIPTGLTRIGTYGVYTALGNPTGGINGLGILQPIDVGSSLAAGVVQPLLTSSGSAVPPTTLTREFQLTGGLTGVTGLDTLYAAGSSHFDPYQTDQFQLGIASLASSGGSLRETTRSAVTGTTGSTTGTTQKGATLSGANAGNPNNALGSVDQNLALITRHNGTVNRVTLYSPTSFASVGTISLIDPNLLTDISGTFRPALANAALVDVQGNTQSFKAKAAQGLVFNGEGNVNLVKIDSATDTTVIGYPFGHALIPTRNNVTIVSSSRSVYGRNGVAVISGLRPTGPLSLPTA